MAAHIPIACRLCHASTECPNCCKVCQGPCVSPRPQSCCSDSKFIHLVSRCRANKVELTPWERDLSCLITVPASDINFTSVLERVDSGLIRRALAEIEGQNSVKTKELALRRQLRKLTLDTTTNDGRENMGKAEVKAFDEAVQIGERKAEAAKQELAELKAQTEENLQRVHNFGVMAGRIQAFKTVQLLSEFLAFKQIAQIIDNGDYKLIPGVTSIDSYFEHLGIKGTTGYNNLKIARALESEEVQLLERVGFTRRDLLGYASLPEEKRLEIKEGKVINIESASKEEIKDLIEQVIVESRQAKDEADKTIKAKDKVLKDKETLINRQAKDLAKFEHEAEARGLTADEDACLKNIENLKMSFDGYLERLDPVFLLNQYDDVTPRMRAMAISAIHYMRMQVLAAYDTAVTTHGNPSMNPELLEDFQRWQTAGVAPTE